MTSTADEDLAWLTSAPPIAPPDGAAEAHTSSSDSITRLRGIFASLDEEIITAVVTSNRGALVPSIMQLIEIADEDETASCMDELEAALQDAAIRDEVPRHDHASDFDDQLALAAQSDTDEQIALALQQKMDADAAAAAASSSTRGRANTPPTLASWRRNVTRLAAKLSPSELGQLAERLKKRGRYRSRAGAARLIDPNEAGATTDNNESDDAAADETAYYEPPVPPEPKPSAAALYESRVARARSARLSSRPVRPNDGFMDLSLAAQ